MQKFELSVADKQFIQEYKVSIEAPEIEKK